MILAHVPNKVIKPPPLPKPPVPVVFGWEHIVYLVIFIALAVGTLIYVNKRVKTEKGVDITVKCVGGVLLAAILANRISLIWFYDSLWALVPNTFCGVISLVYAICMIFAKRDHLIFHFLVYAGFWGGLLVTVYPNFVGQHNSFVYVPTITGLLHHSIDLYASVLLVMTGYVKLNLKKFFAFPVGMCVLTVWGVFILDCLGDYITEAMYLFQPLVTGTFLTWYVVGPAIILASLGGLALWEKVIVPKLATPKTNARKPAVKTEN